MRSILTCFFLTFLSGCANIQSIQPLTEQVTAIVQGDTRQIFWLDEHLNGAKELTQLVILGDFGQYQSEYRWREGELREIERKSELLIDGEQQKQTVLIRYDKSGQANYQKYLVNDEIFPLKNQQLALYFQEAKLAYQTVKALLKKKKVFVQGYMQDAKLIECGGGKYKNVSIRDPLYSDYRTTSQKQFLAAIGSTNFTHIIADTVITLESANFSCFTRPLFSSTAGN